MKTKQDSKKSVVNALKDAINANVVHRELVAKLYEDARSVSTANLSRSEIAKRKQVISDLEDVCDGMAMTNTILEECVLPAVKAKVPRCKKQWYIVTGHLSFFAPRSSSFYCRDENDAVIAHGKWLRKVVFHLSGQNKTYYFDNILDCGQNKPTPQKVNSYNAHLRTI